MNPHAPSSTPARELAPHGNWPWYALGLQLVSGAAGVAYGLLWTDTLGLGLGHEHVAFLAVLSAHLVGMAVGAQVLGHAVAESPAPARWYALCEAVIAAWALVLEKLLPRASELLGAMLGPEPAPAAHWALAFAGTTLLLFPATAAMGGALPALARALSKPGEREALPAVYAAQMLGAALGVLGCTIGLLPALGHAATTRMCGLASGLGALLALNLAREVPAAPARPARAARERRTLIALGVTGLLTLGYELLAVRALAQLFENTTYSFAFSLAAYLFGTSLGAALWRRASALSSGALLPITSAACLAGVAVAGHGASLELGARAALAGVLAPGHAALASEVLVACAVVLPVTLAMGALFSSLCAEAESAGHELGSVLALSTLGAALAPVFCLVLVPWLGLRVAMLIVSLGYLPLVRELLPLGRLTPVLAGGAAAALWSPSPARVPLSSGGRVLSHEEGARANVSVLADARGTLTLHIDHSEQAGSSTSALVDGREAWLPLLLHKAPKRALFLGLGTGISAQAAARDTSLRVDAVELLPEVARAARFFMDPETPAPRVVVADAHRYVRAEGTLFDVVVADVYDPARAGAASLYTAEHFAAVRARLARGGLFCQWLPLQQLDLDSLRSVLATFLSVYPKATALLASYGLDTPALGLIGTADGRPFSAADVAARVAARAPLVAEYHLQDALAVLGSFVAGPEALAQFARGAQLNTDDLPVLAYSAPRRRYAASDPPPARLLALLDALHVTPAELVREAEGDPILVERIEAYLAARDGFVALGARGAAGAPDDLVGALREPLLALVRTSPDFRPAYDPLLQMASHLAVRDVPSARQLLAALAEAQPHRPEAAQLLAHLAPPAP